MPKLNLNRKIVIPVNVEEVYSKLCDFHHWSAWSPWLILEKGADVKVDVDGKYYKWVGNRIGSGEMRITAENPNKTINIDLTFIKPWKSHAKIDFLLESNNDETTVTWTMDSKLPFFMFFIKKMMLAFIGSDFERGLRLLKDLVLDNKVHSELEELGIKTYPARKFIGIKRESSIDDLSVDMQRAYSKLTAFGGDSKLFNGAFSITHNWDLIQRKAVYTAAMSVKEIPTNLPAEFISGDLPELRVFGIRHTGPYHHLANAWGMQSMLLRSKVYKQNKKDEPFEVYVNSPENTDSLNLITDVYFPAK